MEGMHVGDEYRVSDAIEHGLKLVDCEKGPFLLNVDLPQGLPEGGRSGALYNLSICNEMG